MDLDLFKEMLSIDSTSGQEQKFTDYLESKLIEIFVPPVESLKVCCCNCDPNDLLRNDEQRGVPKIEKFAVGDGTFNLRVSFGKPKVVFCSHLDTVPPFIPPTIKYLDLGDKLPNGEMAKEEEVLICGRGSCDAKGQLFAMIEAAKILSGCGCTDFALLFLAGEETGSFGAKSYNKDFEGTEYIIVGEPTDNVFTSACKGTKAFQISIKGRAAHSGYPELGESAVEKFVDLVNKIREANFPEDELLGKTTYNIGKLCSDNPQNILSPRLEARIYFRTTFASDQMVSDFMQGLKSQDVEIQELGGDTPLKYFVPQGAKSKTVSFGSDAPRLEKFANRSLCGPGSIFIAHTHEEFILASDLEKAIEIYVNFYHQVFPKN